MLQGCIFDLDGVLIDSEGIAQEAMNKTFGDLGKPLTIAESTFMLGRSSRDVIPQFLEARGISEPDIQKRVLETHLANNDTLWEAKICLMPQVEEVLSTLKSRKIRLGIATTSRSKILWRFIEKFGLEGVFQCIVSGDMVSKRKPDPEVYLQASKLLQLPAEVTLAVEDTRLGAEAAKAAGLVCVAVPNQHSATHDFHAAGADYIAFSLKEILSFFE